MCIIVCDCNCCVIWVNDCFVRRYVGYSFFGEFVMDNDGFCYVFIGIVVFKVSGWINYVLNLVNLG